MITLRKTKTQIRVAVAAALLLTAAPASAQTLDVPYVTTPHEVVAAMLDIARVGPGDYVIDLGSGDGRIVIAAAKRGAVGHGIDIDPIRVREAEENAAAAGLSDRMLFLEGDLFEADMSRATVITMYLLGTVNLQLRPMLFEQLRPGTRVVSHAFNMFEWEPDGFLEVNGRRIFFWIMPADLRGLWEWTTDGNDYAMSVQQDFQNIVVDLNTGNRSLQVHNPTLTGERVSFTAVDPDNGKRYAFSGRVNGGAITGQIQVRGGSNRSLAPWNAALRP